MKKRTIFLIIILFYSFLLLHYTKKNIPLDWDRFSYAFASKLFSEGKGLTYEINDNITLSKPWHFRLDKNGKYVISSQIGYPFVLGVLHKYFGEKSIFYLNPIITMLLILIVYTLGKNLFSETVGIISSILMMCSLSLFWNSLILMPTVLSTFLVLLAFYFLTISNKKLNIILCGIFFGLSYFIRRENIFLIIPFTIYYFYSKDKKVSKLFLFYLTVIITSFPVFLFNIHHFKTNLFGIVFGPGDTNTYFNITGSKTFFVESLLIKIKYLIGYFLVIIYEINPLNFLFFTLGIYSLIKNKNYKISFFIITTFIIFLLFFSIFGSENIRDYEMYISKINTRAHCVRFVFIIIPLMLIISSYYLEELSLKYRISEKHILFIILLFFILNTPAIIQIGRNANKTAKSDIKTINELKKLFPQDSYIFATTKVSNDIVHSLLYLNDGKITRTLCNKNVIEDIEFLKEKNETIYFVETTSEECAEKINDMGVIEIRNNNLNIKIYELKY